MGFSVARLERGFSRWRATSASCAARVSVLVVSAAGAARAAALAPDSRCIRAGVVLLCGLAVHLAAVAVPRRAGWLRCAAAALLCLDCLAAPPGPDALLPALTAIFAIYSLLSFPLNAAVAVSIALSVVQLGLYAVFYEPTLTNELLAFVVCHVWANFIGIYLHRSDERLARSAFLSGRSSVEAETSALEQSNRLNRLLSAFLPAHLITPARHQIALYSPHIYAEHYNNVTVGYARLIGFESVLAQCSSIDAARVLKELDSRIDRLAANRGCARIASDGITVIASIPGVDSDHAEKVCAFAADLHALVNSFRDATCADVAVCMGVDSGCVSAGIVGSVKWHYDIVGTTVDNAILLQSNAPSHGIFVTDETRRMLGNHWEMRSEADCWQLLSSERSIIGDLFPVNKRYSLVTVPQAINRLLSTVASTDKTIKLGTNKKRKTLKSSQTSLISLGSSENDNSSFMGRYTLRFKNSHLEDEYHREMDHWFIPALAISIFFLVLYGVYHMLVMPRLVTSLALIVVALTLMFFILLMLYINYFQSFSTFITRTSSGHSIAILLILMVLFLCGIVNTFSCPSHPSQSVCRSVHFSALSFALWLLTTAVFLRLNFIVLMTTMACSIVTYGIQVIYSHPPVGPKEFGVEFELLMGLIALAALILLHQRRSEKLMRLDFLSAVKGVEESESKDRLTHLNNQILLNLVPTHVAPWIVSKTACDVYQHAHHSAGVAYLAVSGFSLDGEPGMNGLNFVFNYFDQMLPEFRGIEKIKNANRFYVVAVGLLPDNSQNVDEAPWTIGDLLHTLATFLLHVTKFANEKEFKVQIGVDCGSTLSVVCDPERPRLEVWGDTVERARLLMTSADHERIMASEEIYLALRPRHFNFRPLPVRAFHNLPAYVLECQSGADSALPTESLAHSVDHITDVQASYQLQSTSHAPPTPTMPKSQQEAHTGRMYQRQKELADESSMASSFSSELQSLDGGGGETDSDIEWITPEQRLIKRREEGPYDNEYWSDEGRDPPPAGRHPRTPYVPYKADRSAMYSDLSDIDRSRGPSRMSTSSKNSIGRESGYERRRRWRKSLPRHGSRGHYAAAADARQPRGSRSDVESLAGVEAGDRLEAAANRVDRMLQELNAYGDFADVKPLEYRPFPTSFVGSTKSVHRAMSSACHTEYDNASLSGMSEIECRPPSSVHRKRRARRPRNALSHSRCSSTADSADSADDADPHRCNSAHSIGYENEYEIRSADEECDDATEDALAIEEMKALSRDIRRNFGDFQLASFDDMDQD